MTFFFIAYMFLYIGRKIGWALSKIALYTVPTMISVVLCVVWGIVVAKAIYWLIFWQQPDIILRWIMGYALGAYVAIPNFGLIEPSSIPAHAQARHALVSFLPQFIYIVSLVYLSAPQTIQQSPQQPARILQPAPTSKTAAVSSDYSHVLVRNNPIKTNGNIICTLPTGAIVHALGEEMTDNKNRITFTHITFNRDGHGETNG